MNKVKLTEDLIKEISKSSNFSWIRWFYRPYKTKKHTRASMAKEKGAWTFS